MSEKERLKSDDNGNSSFAAEDSEIDSINKYDPFRNDLKLSQWRWVKVALGTVFLAPVRGLLVILCLLLAWAVSGLGMVGQDKTKPVPSLRGWRWILFEIYSWFGLLVFYSAGFTVKTKGRQATSQEAPILVGSPHSSFLEALILVMCKASPCSRIENKEAILISTCQKFSQTIFVDRRSAESRKAAIANINERAKKTLADPDSDLLQVFIFPEGTNTNRRSLIQFKSGAFNPGVPVQPVLIRYPGIDPGEDFVTWTFCQEHSYLYSVWMMLAKPWNRVEIEFLPVYSPSEEEKENPAVYASNVQKLMASKLGVPATDITYHKYYEDWCKKWEDKQQKKSSSSSSSPSSQNHHQANSNSSASTHEKSS